MRDARRGTKQLIRTAWEEFQITRQCATGAGEAFIAQWRTPGWFIASELGFAPYQGPSLVYILTHLDRINEANVGLLERMATPPTVSKSLQKKGKRRLSSDERQRLLAAQGLAVGIVVDGEEVTRK